MAQKAMTEQDVRRVAAEANVQAATVVRALDGKTRSAATRTAIHAALVKLGFRREAMQLERKEMHTGGGK
ncbi:MAG: hypothetical protein JWL95_3260 [Gemmatimonadetes bacterium]|nr:hypothetical protein [Gemmatimonadota bacterium]